MELLLLIFSLLGLWFGTDLALDGALSFSKRLGVSEGFVGLTILAIGTGLPELVVGLDGGLQQLKGVDASGVVIGNAMGSVIAQGALVLGIAGLMTYLRLAPRMIRRDAVVLILSVVLLALVGFDGTITRSEGGALVVAYALYFASLLQGERGVPHTPEAPKRSAGPWRMVVSIVGGLALVIFSAELAVTNAVVVAAAWGVPQTLVGIFLVGVGTSLPELALSVRAALRGESGISVGNVIGSNTFDLLVPIGASALIFPLTVAPDTLRFDLPAVIVVTLATVFFFLRKRGMQRREAGALLVLYGLYVVVRIWA